MVKINNKSIGFLCLIFMNIMLITNCTSNNKSNTQSQNNNNTKMTINSIEPTSGIAGTNIVISGSGFGNNKGDVKFQGSSGIINSWSDTSINVAVPDITAGNIKIAVISGAKNASVDFMVLPFVSAINKTDTLLNDTIVITGTGFGSTQGSSTVDFAGTVLPVTAWSNNQITAIINNIKQATQGLINITVNNAISNGITLTVHPNIIAVTPDTAERGDEVCISGNLFGPIQGTSSVTFSGVNAIITSWSDTLIKARVPESAIKGNIIVIANSVQSYGMGFTATKTFYTINQPTGIAIDVDKNIYVANYTDGTIIKVLPGGITQTTIYKGLKQPMGIYYQPPSTLFVANEGDGTIQKLTLGTKVTGYTYASGFSMPAGIAFDDTGNMYVTNYGNNTISKVDLNGAISTFAAGLNKPVGIVFTGPTGGKTFNVVNSGNGSIVIVNLLGVVSPAILYLNTPKWLIADSTYNLYITSNNNIVKILFPSTIALTHATGLSNPYGLVMDADGYIYVSNFDNNTISRVDMDYEIYAKGLSKPYGITFSPSGTMFITNQGTGFNGGGSISMVTQSSKVYPFVNPFEKSACGIGSITPMGITTGFQGNLFVAADAVNLLGGSAISGVSYNGNAFVFGNCFLYSFINHVSGIAFNGKTQELFIAENGSGRVFTMTSSATNVYNFAYGFNDPHGIAIDQSDNVYIANAGNGTISQTTSSGTFTSTYASGFNQPYGLAFDTSGNLYVSNYAGNSVSLVTSNKQIYTIASGIVKPTGIAIDNTGIVYVASEVEGNIYKLIHPVALYTSGFLAPKGLAKGINNLIYIADSDSNSIYKIETTGDISRFASNITNPSWFTFDNVDNMYISDFNNGTLIKLSNNNPITFATGLNGPTGIGYDKLNNLLYVSNYLNGTLSVINNVGSVSTIAVGLFGPMGIALLTPSNLFIANSSNGSILKFVPGSGISTFASGLIMPIGIVFDTQNNLYVADQLANMIYIVSSTGIVSSYASVISPYGIAFDNNGNLFVSDTQNKHIKEIILH